MRIGAQMYTLREQCQTLSELYEMLSRVRDIGYTTVQISGTCAYTPEWMNETLQKLDLKCVLTHTNPERMISEPETVCREHDVFHCRNIGVGMMPGALQGGFNDYLEFREKFLSVSKVFKENGHYLMYHNHDIEFAKSPKGKTILEEMMEDFNPDEMGFTFDTYWCQHGGGDPVQWLERLSGRIPCVHFKDMVYSLEDRAPRMAAVGDGNLDFERCLKACENSGTDYVLIEQDYCYGEHPLDCLKRSYDYLHSLGLR